MPQSQTQSQHMGKIIMLVLCVLIPLVMQTSVYHFALLPKRLLLQLGLSILAILWVLDLRKKQSQLYLNPFYLPLTCYLILSIISITQATNLTAALVAHSHQLTFFFLFVFATHLFSRQALMTFFFLSAIVGLIVSLIGICEARGIEGWLPLSNGRPSATFAYRNFAAAFLVMNIPLVVVLILRARNSFDVYLGTFSTAAMTTFLIYTRTRGAWVGLAGALFITLLISFIMHRHIAWQISPLLRKRAAKLSLLGALLLTALLSSLPPQIASQQARAIDDKKVQLLDALSFATTPEADRGRQSMWRHTLEIIQDNPILGVGPGNWQYIYPIYDKGDMLRKDSAPERPHNDYLQIASETGLLSLLLYIWFLITIAFAIIRILKSPSHPQNALIALAFSISILAMLGHSMVSFPNERIPTSFLFWFGLGIIAQLAYSNTARPISFGVSQRIIWLMPLLLIGALYISYQNMQFDRHYLRAFESYHNGNMHRVLSESTSALKWGAFDAQAFLLQGNAYQASGQTTTAQKSYQLGLQQAPNNIQLIGALGNTYAYTNKLDRAEQLYKQALSIYPGYYEMDNNIGGIYQKRGEYTKAIAAYKSVIQKSGGHPDAYTNLGLAYVAVDSTAQAIKAYENALKLAPNDPVIYHDLGEAYYQHASKDPKALVIAQKAFERFLQHWKGPQSDTQKARQRLADIHSRLSP